MPEENEMLEQAPEETRLSNAQLKKERNVANNSKAVSAALEAGKDKNAYVAAAHALDKATGGRLSNTAGKAINTANKFSLGGRMAQAALNKMGESGTTDRISQALSKKNSNAPTQGNVGGKSDATVKDKDSSFFSKKEVHEQTSDGGGVSFQATVKFLKTGLIAFAPVMIVVIFMNLIVSGSQTYIKVIGLDKADKITNSQAEGAIEKHASESLLEEETTDENSQDGAANIGYIYDEFIEDSISKQKFSEMNFVANKSSKFSESEISELRDYYSDIESYEKGKYDMDTVYNFFFKLLYIERHYKNSYNVNLDMPLLMAILTVQSNDMSDVFVSNTKEYRVNSLFKGSKENNKFFKYNHDWSNQKISKNDSTHDIEILAQGMVKKTSDSGCYNTTDGACYELVGDDEYKEFLRGFLEKKYFLNNDDNNENDSDSENNDGNDTATPASGNFREWTQCGQSWSNKQIPNSSETMCQSGCLVTAITMQIARSGTLTLEENLNPGTALKYYKFAKGGNFFWNSTTKLAPNFKYHTKVSLVGMSTQKSIKKLNKYNSEKYYIILGVSKKDKNSIHHFVALDYMDANNNKIYIMDPASTKKTDLYKHYKLYKAYIYEKKD